jgi:hypothetical protein
LLINNKNSFEVFSVDQNNAGFVHFLKRLFSFVLSKLFFGNIPVKHSLNIFSYKPVLKSFELFPSAIHHIHWINNDTLGIFDFNKIPQRAIITLHDEWLYCGAEHYDILRNDFNKIVRYNFFVNGSFLVNLNFIIWKIKLLKLKDRNDIIITVPSKWLMAKAESSLILKNKYIYYLPKPIRYIYF